MNCLEIWKTIEGEQYNQLEISNYGRIKSNNKLLQGEKTKNGYIRIKWSRKGVIYRELLHRLVAKAFLCNDKQLPCVNHINGNKPDNRIENLEWCTYGDNLSHAFKTGLRNANGSNNPNSKLNDTQIIEIKTLYVRGKHSEFNSYGLAKKYGVSPKCIQNIVNEKSYCKGVV